MPKKDPQEITNFYERHDFAEITYSTQRGMEREEKIIGQEEEIDLARDERSLEDLANEGG